MYLRIRLAIKQTNKQKNPKIIHDTINTHIKAFYHLRNISRHPSDYADETLSPFFITFWLDSCTGVLLGLLNKAPERL